MNWRTILTVVISVTLSGLHGIGNAEKDEFPELRGAYLGQTPPGRTPEVFAPGVVSTHCDELNAVFSPHGNLFLFSVKLPNLSQHTMMSMSLESGTWTRPEVLPFSGVYNDADPAFAPGGDRVLFISMRPESGDGPAKKDWDLWMVDRDGSAWSDPVHMGPGINSEAIDVYPSIAADGTLYFSSGRSGGLGKNDIYKAEPVGQGYGDPVNLGEPLNTENSEGDLFVSPREDFMIFVSSGREDAIGRGDLYVSHQNPDGSWSDGENLGPAVNSAQTEYCPVLSNDGKYLFFTSYRSYDITQQDRPLTYSDIVRIYSERGNGLGDIYWVDAGILDVFEPGGPR